MCRYNYIQVFSKILLFGLLLVFNLGSNFIQGAEPLKIVLNSDKYPATSGPFLAAKALDDSWAQPIKFESIKYVGSLPSDAYLSPIGYFSPSTGKAYFYISDARSIYVPGSTSLIASSVNNYLDDFGLSTVIDRQRAIDSLTFGSSSLVDVRDLGNKFLVALGVWIVSGFVIGLPVVVLILGWRRMFQMFLIREIGKAVGGRQDDREN